MGHPVKGKRKAKSLLPTVIRFSRWRPRPQLMYDLHITNYQSILVARVHAHTMRIHKHTHLRKLGVISIEDKHQQTGKLKHNVIEHTSNGALVDIRPDHSIYRVFLFLLLFHVPLLSTRKIIYPFP